MCNLAPLQQSGEQGGVNHPLLSNKLIPPLGQPVPQVGNTHEGGPRAGEEGEGDVVVDFTTRRSVTDGGGGAECTEKKQKKARNNYV